MVTHRRFPASQVRLVTIPQLGGFWGPRNTRGTRVTDVGTDNRRRLSARRSRVSVVGDAVDRDSMIFASGLRKSFGAFEAVRGIDVDVRRGEAFGFLGP